MKNKNILISILTLITLLIIILITRPAKGQHHSSSHHEVVILGYQGQYGPVQQDEYGYSRPQVGLITEWSSCSSGSSIVKPESNLAETLAVLMEQGYQLQPQTVYGEYLLIK